MRKVVPTDWSREGAAVIERAVPIIAALLHRSHAPPNLLDENDLLAMRRGMPGHVHVTRALALARARNLRVAPWFDAAKGVFKRTDHTDPGALFPWETLRRGVAAALEALERRA